jgi:ribonuclease HII
MVAGMEAADVDQLGVGPALAQLVVRTASELLALYPSAILVQDGDIPTPVPGCTNANMAWMPEADVLVPAVSAASMLAKVTRDIDMVQYSMVFPEYGFESNKGYGTAKHEQALMTYGPCPIHRFSYKPVRRYMLQSASWQSPQRKTGIDVWTSYHSPSQPGRSAGANS